LTPLSGFTQGLVRLDSLRCYTPFELRAISNKLIDGAECDTLLKIANATIETQDTLVVSLQQTIIKQDDRYIKTNHLITMCEAQKVAIQKDLKKCKRRLLWTKIGWLSTSVVSVILIVLALLV
jgi:hypothetical protein